MAPESDERAIVLFDGVCNLCSASVRFVVDRDPANRFRFASLQSDEGRTVLARLGLETEGLDSIVLVERGECYRKSTAALLICRRLKRPWPLLYALILVPRFLRDWAYDAIARHRYRWFGKRDECMVPTPELRERFLDAG